MANAMVTKASIEAALALARPPHGPFLTPILSTTTMLATVYLLDFSTSSLSIVRLQPDAVAILVNATGLSLCLRSSLRPRRTAAAPWRTSHRTALAPLCPFRLAATSLYAQHRCRRCIGLHPWIHPTWPDEPRGRKRRGGARCSQHHMPCVLSKNNLLETHPFIGIGGDDIRVHDNKGDDAVGDGARALDEDVAPTLSLAHLRHDERVIPGVRGHKEESVDHVLRHKVLLWDMGQWVYRQQGSPMSFTRKATKGSLSRLPIS
ncbi:hypothetical protein ABZP36_032285 [Zizania latifolia]